MRIIIYPPERLRVHAQLPASKSISNRALVIQALAARNCAGQVSEVRNLSDCDDTQVMLRALSTMPDVIDIMAAGTAMRFLTAYLSITPGTHTITGTERMRHRPIGVLVDALRRLGADVTVINDDYCGTDINVQCGSTHLEPLRALVAECGADVGIAHDGDADRVMLMDSEGNEIDGDMVEAVCAIDLKQRGLLAGDTAVSTVMANLGLTHALRDAGINLIQTKVGDRYVLERMLQGGYPLGGEQSGHLIYRQYSTTGDGLLAALQLLRIVREKEKPLSELAGLLHLFPQKLINVRVEKKLPFEERPAIGKAVADVEKALAGRGRVLLRYSGTEALCRVMVEAEDEDKVVRYARDLADVVSRELR